MGEDKKIRRGQIWYINFNDSWGNEEAVGRPAIVVASNEGIDVKSVLPVVYLTTTPKKGSLSVEINSSKRRSWALCEKITSVDRERFLSQLGETSEAELLKVDIALRKTLALPKSVDISETENELSQLKEETLNLKLELEIQKKMYDRVLGLLVEERVGRDIAVKAPEVVVAPEPPKPEPIEIDTELLKIQMSTPNKLLDEPQENKVKTKLKPKKLSEAKVPEKKANINKDDWRTIWETTGINEQAAKNIVAYRKKHGRFISLEDLLMVPRFGRVMLSRCESLLEV